MDISFFIGQVVTHVNTEESLPLEIVFEKGSLIVECPWRLRKNKEILIGETDCISEPKKFSYKTVKKLLQSKTILNISFIEELILTFDFEENLKIELFHASSYFEGWNLKGDNGFNLLSLPGGEVSEF